MSQDFDKDYWEQHWREGKASGPGASDLPNPYLARELADLKPGTALDAGCGAGAEAIWLADQGWQVTAADISAEALARAAGRAEAAGVAERVRWVEADLTVWEPDGSFDLVTTHYAHPTMPQLEFYDRVAEWVAPGGTLLIVGHLHTHDHDQEHGHGHDQEHGHGHGHDQGWEPPVETMVTAAEVAGRLDERWEIVTVTEHDRTIAGQEGEQIELHDVVVRATRRVSELPA